MSDRVETNLPSPLRDGHTSSPLKEFARDLWLGIQHRPLRTLSILGMVLGVVVGLGVAMRHFSPPRGPVSPATEEWLREALAALDDGRIEAARQLAADLRLHSLPTQDQGLPPYVLGMAMYQDAQAEAWHEQERKNLNLLAARYLDEARQAGFPTGREQSGLRTLGKSWFACGRFGDAIPPLRELLDQQAIQPTEVYQVLAECYLRSTPPDLEQASDCIERLLEVPSLGPTDRDQGLVTQARIQFQLGRFAESQETIDALTRASALPGETLLLAARLRLREGDALLAGSPPNPDEAKKNFQLAKEFVEQAGQSGARTEEFHRQRQYLWGLSCRRLGDNTAALGQFERTSRTHFDTPEGIACGVEQAEILQQLGKDEAALAVYGRTLRNAAERKLNGEPWLSGDELRRRVEEVIQSYVVDERHAEAAELTDSLHVLFPDARSLALQVSVHQSWADWLQQRAKQDPADADEWMAQARSQRRHVGKCSERLARLRFATREYANQLWESAESYLNGQDYDSAARMYQRFLEHRERAAHPPALVRLGEVGMARNDPAGAIRWLQECIELYPRDPYVYRARLLAAEGNVELGELERAKELLTTNLENDSLTPASPEWRESLLLIGRIFHQEGMRHEALSRLRGVDSTVPAERQAGLVELRRAGESFRECIRRLTEAVRRDPDFPQVIEVRYLLAQSRLQLAKLRKKELLDAGIETTRAALRQETQNSLLAASTAYEELKSLLLAKQEQGALSAVDERILRNCYFALADVLFDLQQYEEAIQAYASATNRFQLEPESLEAYVQIANCHGKLNRSADARRTLEQAKLILNRIRPDADFLATTRYDRQEWVDLLNWLTTL